MEHEPIPFLDLVTVHRELEEEFVQVLRTALKSAAFIGGPMLQGFEQDFARFSQVDHCVGVSSGTDALRFALTGAGVRPGDMVVTVPNTFIATTEAISQAGARPDFVDIDARTYNMNPMLLRRYMEHDCTWNAAAKRAYHRATGSPVTAVVPVHLYGQMADMDAILAVADEFNLKVVEDACQAHGAEYFSRKDNQWHRAGSIGHAAAFSFYPGKNLGACGEAGAIITHDAEIARTCRLLRDHGQSKKYCHDIEGYNGRLDAIQAGFLRIKLRRLKEWNDQRRDIAERYHKLFAGIEALVQVPHQPEWSRSVHHLYVVRVAERARLQDRLTQRGIGTGIHYPNVLHLTNPYLEFGYEIGDLPIAEQAASEVLSLPMFPGLAIHQQERVVVELQQAATISAVTR